MNLQVMIPARVVLRDRASAVVAEGYEGSFGVLPRHIDYVSPLLPGILTYRREEDGVERVLAVDRGILVKAGDDVLVSVRDAVAGDDLETLRDTVHQRFQGLDERERQARTALATLEARFLRRFMEQVAHVHE